jgi:hypothetical protein
VKTNITIAAACLILIPGLGLANQVQLNFIPASQSVLVGGTIDVAVGISLLNIDEPPSLGAYDLNVLFDPGIFSFSGVTFGDPVLGDQLDLFALGDLQTATPGIGNVNLFELSFDSPADLNTLQAGDFTLFTLTLSALAPGTSPLSISVNGLSDADGAPITLIAGDGSATAIGLTGTPTPEPGTALLFGLGLAAISALRWRQSR